MLSEQTRLMEVLRVMNSRKADRQRGRGVRWRDFLLRGSLTLTMEPQPATQIALSDSISCSHSLPRCLFLYLTVSLFPSPPLLTSPLARSESSLLAVAAEMHHKLSAAAHPLLPHVCSFSRQAGLKSQLRIEPSRLKPVSNQPSPPPTPLPNPRLVSIWVQWKNGWGAGDLALSLIYKCKMALWPHYINILTTIKQKPNTSCRRREGRCSFTVIFYEAFTDMSTNVKGYNISWHAIPFPFIFISSSECVKLFSTWIYSKVMWQFSTVYM